MPSEDQGPRSPRLRIGILGSFPPQSQGVTDYCAELVRSLARRYEVIALGFSAMYPARLYPGTGKPTDESRTRLEVPNLTVRHCLTYYNPWGWLRAACTLQVDVFHVQWWSLPLWPVTFVLMLGMRLRRKRVVLTLHNILPHDASSWFVPAGRWLCRLAHSVVVHHPEGVALAAHHYRLDESTVHCVGHGLFFSRVLRLDPAACRRQLGVEETCRVVLLFGALREYKGIGILLQAFGSVVQQLSDVHLVVAGTSWIDWGPHRDTISELGLGDRVHLFLEYVPEERVPVYFSAADLVVLPYTSFAAQSGVGATALPYRKPMIVTRTGGLPEWVDHDPSWIVPPGDAPAIARRIVEFFQQREQQEEQFQRLADRVLEASSWNHLLEAYSPIYDPTPRRERRDATDASV